MTWRLPARERYEQFCKVEGVPADLVYMLINRVGLAEDQVAELSKARAIERLQQFWTEGH